MPKAFSQDTTLWVTLASARYGKGRHVHLFCGFCVLVCVCRQFSCGSCDFAHFLTRFSFGASKEAAQTSVHFFSARFSFFFCFVVLHFLFSTSLLFVLVPSRCVVSHAHIANVFFLKGFRNHKKRNAGKNKDSTMRSSRPQGRESDGV